MMAMLQIEQLASGYGTTQVLFGVDLIISTGEVASLLGRNGMGKSTLIKSIMGLVKPQSGQIYFRGERIVGLAPDRIARDGFALVPEGRQIFPNLSVEENLIAFAANRNQTSTPWTLAKIYEFFPRLAERANSMGSQLSGGEQQMLAIGRALITNPHLLILDEATEGLAPLVRAEIWRCLAQLKASGQTLLIVDKYIHELLDIADHHTILEKGKVVWHGDSRTLKVNPEIWNRYLGI